MIKIRFIWSYIPILVFVKDMIPKKFGAMSLTITTFIRPKWKDDDVMASDMTGVRLRVPGFPRSEP